MTHADSLVVVTGTDVDAESLLAGWSEQPDWAQEE